VKFSHPGWLAVGLAACLLLLWMWRRYDARQHAALARFVSAHLRDALTQSISVTRRRLRRGLFLIALALLFVALAGPLVGYRWEQISRRGNEIVFAIDTSRSMSTPDIKPDRLTRAKLAIDDFANRLDGDAVGIVAFAGSAFLVCPITLDYGAFHESLGAVDTNTIPRGGTNIASAIHEAQAALRRRPGSDKILILVTDGEDLEGSALDASEAAAKQDGLKIFTVGVGTAGGDLIPVPPEQGGGFVKDESGEFVKSRLDEPALRAIAGAAGGFYAPLGLQGEGLETIFTKVLGPLAKHDLASRQQKVYIERYQWPLAASLGTLLASLLVGTRRRRAGVRRLTTPVAAGASGLLLLTLLPLHPLRAAAPSAPVATLDYNAGTAAYRAGRFLQAAQAFQQSISQAPSNDPKRLADQEDAYYNLGNTLYRTGQKTEQSAPQETLKTWNDAVKAYETALQLRADDVDSKFNRDLVKRKIAALQQQQQKQDPNQGQGKGQGQGQGNGQGQGQGQDKSQAQGQNQPPNKGSGQQQGQPPDSPQNAKNDDSKQGQQPSKGDQPPPSAAQPPASPQGAGPQGSAPQSGAAAVRNPDNQMNADAQTADNEHLPGQMSREEARELLDSVKGDERHALGAPLDRRDVNNPPQQPFKNW
jgi:Ca-activated chloride channel family protein